jgi:lysozyme
MTSTIIDVYYQNDIDLASAQKGGVTAVIHKATEGTYFADPKYGDRKDVAKKLGLPWGAFHLSSSEDVKSQLDAFLKVESGTDPAILMALDWEKSQDRGIMSLDQVHEFVARFHDRLGYYPMIYGGWVLRETNAVLNGDSILSRCPLWYQRYEPTPIGLPTKTWADYTLWQYDNDDQQNHSPHIQGTKGADWNHFDGAADLADVWPFRQPAWLTIGEV